MRIWLDPAKLTTYQLSTADVIAALRAQNAQVAVGQLGGTPAVTGQQLNATITSQGASADARAVSRDRHRAASPTAARATWATSRASNSAPRTTASIARYNGQPAAGLAVSLATGANALDTAEACRRAIDAAAAVVSRQA